jgi:hypothetical protein
VISSQVAPYVIRSIDGEGSRCPRVGSIAIRERTSATSNSTDVGLVQTARRYCCRRRVQESGENFAFSIKKRTKLRLSVSVWDTGHFYSASPPMPADKKSIYQHISCHRPLRWIAGPVFYFRVDSVATTIV